METCTATIDRMRADAVLPDDIRPALECGRPLGGEVLLTGATGFVGAYVLATLMRETTARVVCMVRPRHRRDDSFSRIRKNLASYGLWNAEWAQRILPLAGDLCQPKLGLACWDEIAERVDAIFHVGASVNWVLPYSGLRGANVLGTLELLRLACWKRATPFHFLSTLSVCYATGGNDCAIGEQQDTWPLLDRLHLGYAQSKCVAERLVNQARDHGLPTVIYRPTLITGESESGASNPGDILARAIAACVLMKCAPDIDWTIDACPVDHVAHAVVRHAFSASASETGHLHLRHRDARHWRELVLWMRLRGYQLRLLPFREWVALLETHAIHRTHPLYPLMGFFRASVGDLTLPETYLCHRRSRICDHRTRSTLTRLGIADATLDALWLERFFASLTARGAFPALRTRNEQRHPPVGKADLTQELFRRHFDDPHLESIPVGPARRLSRQSILSELTSWKCGSAVGVFRQSLALISRQKNVPAQLDIVAKVGGDERSVLDVADVTAEICHPRLGVAFAKWRDHLGLRGGHAREVQLYNQTDSRWRRLTPACFGAARDELGGGVILMEDLSGNVWMDSCEPPNAWRPSQLAAAVRGLAELHSLWLMRRPSSELPSIIPLANAARMEEMTDLWAALASHAEQYFLPWLGPNVRRIQQRLLCAIGRWRLPLEQMPATLIHNDFNPRNIAIRSTGEDDTLCAFDWELAAWGAPQHDLAQLLCFTLSPECPRSTVDHYLEMHRHLLEAETGVRISANDWRQGFGLALAELFLNRLPMYTLMHAIRRQPFLEPALRTWRTLFRHYDGGLGIGAVLD